VTTGSVRRAGGSEPRLAPSWVEMWVGRSSPTDKSLYVRYGVAANPSTPVGLLTKLATDEDNYIRSEVAANPSTPGELLTKLATDEHEFVRSAVARNPNAPKK